MKVTDANFVLENAVGGICLRFATAAEFYRTVKVAHKPRTSWINEHNYYEWFGSVRF